MISLSLYAAALIMGAGFCAFLGVAAFLKKGMPGARSLGAFMLASSLYVLGSGFELASMGIEAMLLFRRIGWIGSAFLPAFWLLFALRFARPEPPARPLLALLFLEPVAASVLAWMNGRSGPCFANPRIGPGPLALLVLDHGPAWWAHAALSLAMFAAGILVLALRGADASPPVRRRALVSVAGILLPMTADLLLIAGATPFGIDPGPVAVILSGLLFAWAIYRLRFFDLLPVARERVLESLDEGLAIMDQGGRVAYFNPSAASMLGLEARVDRRGFASALETRGLADLAAEGQGKRELEVPWEGGSRRVRAKAFPVRDERARAVGSALLLADVTETALLVDRLEMLASVDGLTGAFNRRRFDEIGGRDIELSRRARAPIGVLMMDIDFFKRVNDEWGHVAGDEVLKAICSLCKAELRTTDALARYGGEEFAVLLPGSDADGAMGVAERLRAGVESNPFRWEGAAIPVTISVGTYAGAVAEGEDLERLVRRADEALYAAKARGRNRVEFWSPGARQ